MKQEDFIKSKSQFRRLINQAPEKMFEAIKELKRLIKVAEEENKRLYLEIKILKQQVDHSDKSCQIYTEELAEKVFKLEKELADKHKECRKYHCSKNRNKCTQKQLTKKTS